MTPPADAALQPQWQRLSPRMLLVHPVHEVLQQIPLLIGAVVLGSATGNQGWTIAAIVLTVGVGLARWFTTGYRIEPDEVQLRTGLLQRKVLSVPRNRIRSVSTDARLLHRLLGLTVLRISTGQEAKGDTEFALDAVEAQQVPRLRAILLADTVPVAEAPAGRELARWQPSWLRYSPLSFTGLAMIAAAVGVIYQAGVGAALGNSDLAQSGIAAAERLGVLVSVVVGVLAVLVASVVLSVLRSLLTYGNLVLRRDSDVLHLQHGLLRLREHTYDMRRMRGGSLREPLLVRAFGGARLDAVMTGVGGEAEASLLLPPCPAATARTVLAELTATPAWSAQRWWATVRLRRAGAGPGPWRCPHSSGRRCSWSQCRCGSGCCGRCLSGAQACWPQTGPDHSVIWCATAGWSPAQAAWNGAAITWKQPGSSGGRCARPTFSAAPGWPP